MSASLFYFGCWSGTSVLDAEIRASINSKRTLLSTLDLKLRFPGYFGHNWDALVDCMRDLSWLPQGNVVIRHLDLPIERDPQMVETYLSVLSIAVATHLERRERRLIVVFPSEYREKITGVLG